MKKIYLSLLIGIFLIGVVSSATYCCEKTKSGAWCQNVENKDICNDEYRSISSFCASTSYCKIGTCINQEAGTCSQTTQVICKNNDGYWSDKLAEELPQCKLGCCLIGDGASFVTSTACNRLATLYHVEVNYQSKINDELTCLASANPNVKGACVYTQDYSKTCQLTTKSKCQTNAKDSSLSGVEFHEGYLCSAQELETICGKSEKTRCEGDDVYFVDSCNNLANIYDSSKVIDEDYWTKIQEPTCRDGVGNKDSKSCGDCDYYSGSMCQEKKTGETVTKGNYFCKNLDCKDYRGPYTGSSSYPLHGEKWCATDSGKGYELRTGETEINIVGEGNNLNPVGNTHVMLICYNGEVTKEICSTERQEICAESTYEGTDFKTAGCKKNAWEYCWSQGTQTECENVEKRDCSWIDSYGYSFSDSGLSNTNSSGICVPKYSPGYEEQDDKVIGGCTATSATCAVVMVKKGLSTEWECKKGKTEINFLGIVLREKFENNCECVGGEGENDNGTSWSNKMNNICTQMGDCGEKENYIKELGYKFNPITITRID